MSVIRRIPVVAVLVALIALGCSEKRTEIQASVGADQPNNGFPVNFGAIISGKVKVTVDPPGDVGFFNGKDAGRKDPWVDMTKMWMTETTLNAADAAILDAALACGKSDTQLVVCGPTKPAIAPGPYLLFAVSVAGDLPTINPPGETGRVSLLIDAGGDGVTKSKATPQAPDLVADGTNMVYELIYGTPGEGRHDRRTDSRVQYGRRAQEGRVHHLGSAHRHSRHYGRLGDPEGRGR